MTQTEGNQLWRKDPGDTGQNLAKWTLSCLQHISVDQSDEMHFLIWIWELWLRVCAGKDLRNNTFSYSLNRYFATYNDSDVSFMVQNEQLCTFTTDLAI